MIVQNTSQIQFDVALANVESQPLQFETLFPSSDLHMEEVDLLNNFPTPNSLTLHLEKPISETDDHLSQDLLGHQSIISKRTSEFVEIPRPSLFTDSLVVSTNTSTANLPTSSIDKCSSVNGCA